ncbi:MAG: hypothetical protein JW966_16415 [Anaerolineae bacterium]|nr:hypothetical protein [Anaerolineae bacterium]
MNQVLNRRDIVLLVAGLVVGLVIGIVLIGSNDDLRTDLFGSSAKDNQSDSGTTSSKTENVMYYLTEVTSAKDWLSEKYPETSDSLDEAADVIAKPSTWENTSEGVKQAKDYIDTVLPQMYAALVNADDIVQPKVAPDNDTSVCLAIDDDPYNIDGPIVYMYLTIPVDQVDTLDIPDDWEQIKDAKSDQLYWQLLACFPEPDKKPS